MNPASANNADNDWAEKNLKPEELNNIKWGFCIGAISFLGKFAQKIKMDGFIARRFFKRIRRKYPYVEYLNIDGPLTTDTFVKTAVQYGFKIILGANKPQNYLHHIEDWNIKIINTNNPAEIRELIANL